MSPTARAPSLRAQCRKLSAHHETAPMPDSSGPQSWADPSVVCTRGAHRRCRAGHARSALLIRQPLGWLFLATFLAIAVSGPVAFFSRFLPRGGAIAITYLLLLLVPVALGPGDRAVGGERRAVAHRCCAAPGARGADLRGGIRLAARHRGAVRRDERAPRQGARAPQVRGRAASWLGSMGLGIVSSGFAVVNIVLMSIFLVSGGPRWARAFLARQEAQHAERVERVLVGVAQTVGNYVMGALGQALIAGILTWIVLVILGVPLRGRPCRDHLRARSHSARRRDDRSGARRHRHALLRLPGDDHHLGHLGCDLSADREHVIQPRSSAEPSPWNRSSC